MCLKLSLDLVAAESSGSACGPDGKCYHRTIAVLAQCQNVMGT